MTVQMRFDNWSSSGLDWRKAPYEACSPNLQVLNSYLMAIGGQHLGCHGNRDIRAGGAVSAHAYGAALDWRYEATTNGGKNLGRAWALNTLFPWLINYSLELGIDAIHDYVGDRIWRAGRTSSIADAHTGWWKKQNGAGESGMGQAWATYVHIETTRSAFSDSRPISNRGIPAPGGATPGPSPDPKPDPTPSPPSTGFVPSSLEFTEMLLAAKTTNGPFLAATGFKAGTMNVGPSDQHDISIEQVFDAGNGKVLNVGVRPFKVQTRNQFNATSATLTEAQGRALLGARV